MAVTTFASPPWWRIALALAVVPLVASFEYAVFSPAYQGLPDMTERIIRTTQVVAFIGAYPPTLVLGIPLLLYLRGRIGPSLANCVMAGALVATLPWICLVLFFGPDQASTDDHVTYQNGMMTWWGFLEAVELLAEITVFGIAAGALFWLLAAAGVKSHPASQSE
jgi:hypothetical protein